MTNTKLAQTALRGTVWSTIGNYLSQMIGFVALLVLTRMLSPEIFGSLSLATFWVGLLQIRNKLGLSYGAIRNSQVDGDLLGSFTILDASSAFLSLLITVIAALILQWRAVYSTEVIRLILCLAVAEQLNSLMGPYGMVLEKEMQLSRSVLVSLAATVISYSTAILLAFSGFGIWSLVAISFINYGISVIGIYIACRQRLPQVFQLRWHINRALVKEILWQGIATGFATAILGVVVSQFDNFLIGTFVGERTLGFYDRAFRIASWPNIVLTMIIARVGYLTMAKVKDDRVRLTHTVRLSFWLLASLGLPIGLTLLFGARDVIAVVYGTKWLESAFFLRFLAGSALAGSFMTVSFWLAVALGDRRQTIFLAVAQAIVLIVIGFPMTQLWGATGTVIAVCIMMIVGLWIGMNYLFKQVDLTVKESFGVPLLATSITSAFMLLLMRLPPWQQQSSLIHALVTPAIIFLLFFVTIYLFDRQETQNRFAYLLKTWKAS